MYKLLPGLALLLCALVPFFEAPVTLEGAWQVTERAYTRGDSSWVVSDLQPGVYIFTASYYGVQEIRESGPRPLFTAETTDQERLGAFEVFHAHTGRYALDGDTLRIWPVLAKGPNTMDGGSYAYQYALVGERLIITRTAPAGPEVRVTTLTRLE